MSPLATGSVSVPLAWCQAVHSGADLESAAAACMGYKQGAKVRRLAGSKKPAHERTEHMKEPTKDGMNTRCSSDEHITVAGPCYSLRCVFRAFQRRERACTAQHRAAMKSTVGHQRHTRETTFRSAEWGNRVLEVL